MKLTKKLVRDVSSEIVGDDGKAVVDRIYGKKDVSEFEIAEMFGDDINVARNVLYRLHNEHLVFSTKRKDKSKGWYVYYWTLNLPRFKDLSIQLSNNKIMNLKRRLEREKDQMFFTCTNNCVRLDFEVATDFEFKCPECNCVLMEEDNTNKITRIEKELAELQKSITA